MILLDTICDTQIVKTIHDKGTFVVSLCQCYDANLKQRVIRTYNVTIWMSL